MKSKAKRILRLNLRVIFFFFGFPWKSSCLSPHNIVCKEDFHVFSSLTSRISFKSSLNLTWKILGLKLRGREWPAIGQLQPSLSRLLPLQAWLPFNAFVPSRVRVSPVRAHSRCPLCCVNLVHVCEEDAAPQASPALRDPIYLSYVWLWNDRFEAF